jgi:hypothetical protein
VAAALTAASGGAAHDVPLPELLELLQDGGQVVRP